MCDGVAGRRRILAVRRHTPRVCRAAVAAVAAVAAAVASLSRARARPAISFPLFRTFDRYAIITTRPDDISSNISKKIQKIPYSFRKKEPLFFLDIHVEGKQIFQITRKILIDLKQSIPTPSASSAPTTIGQLSATVGSLITCRFRLH